MREVCIIGAGMSPWGEIWRESFRSLFVDAARSAIENGNIITKTWNIVLEITFDYTQMDMVMRLIKDEGLRIIRQNAKDNYCIVLEIRKGSFEFVKNKLSSMEKLVLSVI